MHKIEEANDYAEKASETRSNFEAADDYAEKASEAQSNSKAEDEGKTNDKAGKGQGVTTALRRIDFLDLRTDPCGSIL